MSRGPPIENLAHDHSVQRACGWQPKVAEDILDFLELALEEGSISLTELRCKHILKPLEDIDGERDGKDRGPYRLLKTVSVLLRLRGFQRGEPPFREMIIYGQPLLGNTSGLATHARALEQAVHLCRTSARLKCVQLINCHLDASEACVAEVIRLVKLLGTCNGGHFLEELNLSENRFDDAAAGRLIEAAVRERCERSPQAAGASTALWLDLSVNCIKHPQTVFQKLEARSSWAYREKAICLVKSSSCSKQECKHSSLVHLPAFLEQESKVSQVVLVERDARNGSARGEPLVMRPRINLLPGPGARASMSRSRSRGSSGGRSLHARSNGETEEEEEEFEEEEEEDFEDDESEGEGARKRRRKDISAGSGSESNSEGSQKRLSKAQVEERLDRLLNQLKQTERIGNNGASPSDPVLSQPEVQPKIGDEDLPSLKADGQDADFSAQDLGKDEKALELTNGGSHDQDIPGDCQQMQVDRQEMPTEYQGKTDCEHGMPADHEEMPASQQEKVADHHEILVQEQEKATDLQEMPSEHAIETEGSQDNPPICIEMDRSMQNRVDTNDAKDVSIKNPDELDGNQNQMIANDNTLL